MQNKSSTQLKVLITGGHVTTALAVISEIQDKKDWQIIFVGRQSAMEGSREPSLESQRIPKMGIKFCSIPAGKIPRYLSLKTITAMIRIPLGFLSAFFLVLRERPDIILTFGGYIAVPVAFSGWLLRIPIVTHEQTVKIGLANEFIELVSDQIAVSWRQSQKHFKRNTTLTGPPIRKAILHGVEKPLEIELEKRPLIYVTGGNLGAHIINQAVKKALPKLLKKYSIVHQIGPKNPWNDYQNLIKIEKDLSPKLRKRYLIRHWFDEQEVSWLLRKADLVIGRSGANITAELALLGTTALLIPLPIAGRNEQLENARMLVKLGTAEILEQHQLSPERLLEKIDQIFSKITEFKKNASKTQALVIKNASENLVKLLEKTHDKKKKT